MSRSGVYRWILVEATDLAHKAPVEGAFFVPNIWGVTSCSMNVSGALHPALEPLL